MPRPRLTASRPPGETTFWRRGHADSKAHTSIASCGTFRYSTFRALLQYARRRRGGARPAQGARRRAV
eukprot:5979339-Prymnesium_polylepis.1